jgi:hypothetical protein
MLVLRPTASYWYLHALFFIFLITPTFQNKRAAYFGFTIAIGLKTLKIIGGYGVQAISYILDNEIWFVIGMCLSIFDFRQYTKNRKITEPIIIGVIFMILSVMVYELDVSNGWSDFLLGQLACAVIILFMVEFYVDGKQVMLLGFLQSIRCRFFNAYFIRSSAQNDIV